MPIITLTTDYGTKDYYVGALKGVLLQIVPAATLVDITHDIQAHNVIHGAFVLRHAVSCYPRGTVHVAVVDPGVGSPRRILAGRYSGQIVIAPDNGLISFIHREMRLEEIYTVENAQHFPGPVSRTFHGRDILAPVAARVAAGLSLSRLGRPAGQIEVLQIVAPRTLTPPGLAGQVLYTDHFGNLITNIGQQHLAELFRHRPDVKVYVGERCIGPLQRTYSDVGVGELLAILGSAGLLEVSVNCGRAGETLAVGPQAQVFVR